MPSDPIGPLVTLVTPQHRWADLQLPEPVMVELRRLPREIGSPGTAATARATPQGTSALFAGPSTAAKMKAAEAVAGELKSSVLRVDLAAVVNANAGETEKNLDAVFANAKRANAVLFFDEADALFGKRSDVKDAAARGPRLGADHLLRQIDEYPGLAILSAARTSSLDDAFIRRIRFVVEFG
jgi:SpoVK/Ycf46/Vps4 family AAA+-type ATPase